MVKGAARTHVLWIEEGSRRSPHISRLGGSQIVLAFRLHLHDHGLKNLSISAASEDSRQ